MLTGEEKKQYQRDYMAKKRSNKGLTENDVRPTEMLDPGSQNVRPDVRPLVRQPDVIGQPGHLEERMKDPASRKNLWKICKSLDNHNVSDCVTYGAYGPTFTQIEELLEQTRALD